MKPVNKEGNTTDIMRISESELRQLCWWLVKHLGFLWWRKKIFVGDSLHVSSYSSGDSFIIKLINRKIEVK